jgi:hypothetical protein
MKEFVMHELNQHLGYFPLPLLLRIAEGIQKIQWERQIPQD